MPVKPLWTGNGKIDTEGNENVAKKIIFDRLKAINIQIAGQKIQVTQKSQILKKRQNRI